MSDEDMERLLVIGASGLLGSKVMEQARCRYAVSGAYNPDVDGASTWKLEPVDIGSKDDIDKLFEKTKPNIVILTAAMTAVDACEKDPTMANRINAAAPGLVARASKKASAHLVHVSTDYVFDGIKSRRYHETDVPRPISVYGASKLAGERAVMSAFPKERRQLTSEPLNISLALTAISDFLGALPTISRSTGTIDRPAETDGNGS